MTVHPKHLESLRRVFKTLRAYYPVEPLYGARCCGRTWLGVFPAPRCRTCSTLITNRTVQTEDELVALVE